MTGTGDERGERPTAREIADLLAEHQRMIAAAGGWTSRIPHHEIEAWEARKADVLARIAEHSRPSRQRDHDQRELGL